jgi:hypothetical protein
MYSVVEKPSDTMVNHLCRAALDFRYFRSNYCSYLARFPFVPILSNLTGTEPIIVILWKEIDCLVFAELHHSRKIEFDQYNLSVQIVVISDPHL